MFCEEKGKLIRLIPQFIYKQPLASQQRSELKLKPEQKEDHKRMKGIPEK